MLEVPVSTTSSTTPTKHHEAAERGHEQGLQRRTTAGRATAVVTDEEIGEDAQ